MATMGWLSLMFPAEPKNGAVPKENTPPSHATVQSPCGAKGGAGRSREGQGELAGGVGCGAEQVPGTRLARLEGDPVAKQLGPRRAEVAVGGVVVGPRGGLEEALQLEVGGEAQHAVGEVVGGGGEAVARSQVHPPVVVHR